MIRAEIKAATGLTASAGVSYNKFIAKLASDQNKPDGLCVILPEHGATFVASLPIRRFHGVGPRTAEKMERLGIAMGADLCAKDEQWLLTHFGSWGSYLFNAARGIDHRPVNPNQIRKSLGGELTYSVDKIRDDELRAAIDEIIEIVWDRIERYRARGRTVTLKVRYADFCTLTRSRSVDHIVTERAEFVRLGHGVLDQLLPASIGIRLLGLTLSNLINDDETGDASDEQAAFPFAEIEK
jgi:DNA polymerase-4